MERLTIRVSDKIEVRESPLVLRLVSMVITRVAASIVSPFQIAAHVFFWKAVQTRAPARSEFLRAFSIATA